MASKNKSARASDMALIVLSIIGCLFWLALLFFALFLGGSPGPGYARTVPMRYVCLIALGLAGAVIGTITATRSPRGASSRGKAAAGTAALLGAAGSVPMFLLELTAIGVVCLAAGLLPPVLYFVQSATRDNNCYRRNY